MAEVLGLSRFFITTENDYAVVLGRIQLIRLSTRTNCRAEARYSTRHFGRRKMEEV